MTPRPYAATALERAARAVWPFVTRRRLDALQTENYTLGDALREANAELLKHRRLLADVRAKTRIIGDVAIWDGGEP